MRREAADLRRRAGLCCRRTAPVMPAAPVPDSIGDDRGS